MYWFQLFIIQICTLMDDSTFASRKSSLRAFIWCLYLHFTKNVTYTLLVLTPRCICDHSGRESFSGPPLCTQFCNLYVKLLVAISAWSQATSCPQLCVLCAAFFKCKSFDSAPNWPSYVFPVHVNATIMCLSYVLFKIIISMKLKWWKVFRFLL